MGKKSNWILVAIIAAVVAALTAAVVFILRARKEKAWYDEEPIDCDLDDAECFEFDDVDIEPIKEPTEE